MFFFFAFGCHDNSCSHPFQKPSWRGFLHKAELIADAQHLCDVSFTVVSVYSPQRVLSLTLSSLPPAARPWQLLHSLELNVHHHQERPCAEDQ